MDRLSYFYAIGIDRSGLSPRVVALVLDGLHANGANRKTLGHRSTHPVWAEIPQNNAQSQIRSRFGTKGTHDCVIHINENIHG
jgi:hypothetical protein